MDRLLDTEVMADLISNEIKELTVCVRPTRKAT